MGCWEEDNRDEVLFSLYLIKGTGYQPDLPLLMLTLSPGQSCVSQVSVKLLFPFLSIHYSLEASFQAQSTLKEDEEES